MTAIQACFFCGTGIATHELQHSILGPRLCCAECDPATAARTGRDTLERMTGSLVAWAQAGSLDLGDEICIDGQLRADGYSEAEIVAFQERATEAARRQLQRTAARFRPFEFGVEAAAFGLMIGAWVIVYVALVPPAPHHYRDIHFAQAQR